MPAIAFTAQLSNSAGSFSSPVSIGSVTVSPVGSLQSINITALMPYPLSNGTGYRVRVIANTPAVTGSDNGQNLVILKPSLPSILTKSKCAIATYDLTTVFTDATLTYTYFNNAFAVVSNPNSVTTGSYNIVGTNSGGCKDTTLVNVTDYSRPNLGSDITRSKCAVAGYDLRTAFTNASYTYGYFSSSYVPLSRPDSVNSGTYYVIATNTNGCKDTAKVTVTNYSRPSMPSTLSKSKCAVSTYDLTTVFTDATLTYSYFDNVFASVSNPASVPTGNYNIVGTNSNGCKDTTLVKITDYSRPNLGSDITRSKCTGFGYDLRTSFTNSSYSYSYFSSTYVPLSRPDSVNTGSYYVVATNTNGCKDTAKVTVTNYPKPNMPSTYTKSKCVSAGYNLTSLFTDATLTYGYFDNTFAVVSNPTNVGAGVYNVVGTNTSGCKDTTVVTINNLSCATPVSPVTSSITGSSAVVKWRLNACALRYELQYRAGTTGSFITISLTDTSYTLTGLTSSTSYQWKVRSVCLESPFTTSGYTTTTTFTTGSGARGTNEDIVSMKVTSEWSAAVYPNPAYKNARLEIKGITREYNVTLTSIEGKVLWQSQRLNTTVVALPIDRFVSGVYLVIVDDGTVRKTLRIVIER